MNNCSFVGGITADAKLNDAATVARFSLGVTRPFKNKEGKYDSDYIPCVLYGDKVVGAFKDSLVKGAQFEIVARYQTTSYEKDGKTVYGHEFVVEKLRPIGGNRGKATQNKEETETSATPASSDGFVEVDDAALPWN